MVDFLFEAFQRVQVDLSQSGMSFALKNYLFPLLCQCRFFVRVEIIFSKVSSTLIH